MFIVRVLLRGHVILSEAQLKMNSSWHCNKIMLFRSLDSLFNPSNPNHLIWLENYQNSGILTTINKWTIFVHFLYPNNRYKRQLIASTNCEALYIPVFETGDRPLRHRCKAHYSIFRYSELLGPCKNMYRWIGTSKKKGVPLIYWRDGFKGLILGNKMVTNLMWMEKISKKNVI